MSPATSSRYHHGDLPNALKQAAAEVIVEKGHAGFSLREVARRAGVSHAAPAHHFGDSTGLLTALATDAFRAMDEAMAALETEAIDPPDRLLKVGQAYVQVAQTHPAHCGLICRPDLVDTTNVEFQEWGDRAYGHLESALEDVRAKQNPALDVANAALLCWSAMQGLVVLHDGMAARAAAHGLPMAPIDDVVTRFGELLLGGLRG